MDILQAIEERHSVRQYADKAIEQEKRQALCDELKKINTESGLNIQILFDEPKCFDSMMAHYGKFFGVNNYIALVGKKGKIPRREVRILRRKIGACRANARFEYVLGCNVARQECGKNRTR